MLGATEEEEVREGVTEGVGVRELEIVKLIDLVAERLRVVDDVGEGVLGGVLVGVLVGVGLAVFEGV